MRWFRWLGLGSLLAGAVLIAGSLATGEGHVYLLVIFPVFTSTGALGLLGILAVFLGLFLGMAPVAGLGFPAAVPASPSVPPSPQGGAPAPRPRYGGVVMLGPIPIVFGSDPATAKWMVLLGFLLLAVTLGAWVLWVLR